MKSQGSTGAGDPRRCAPAPANGSAGRTASILGSGAERKAKMFAGISRNEQLPRIPFTSFIHHHHIWRGIFILNHQFISILTNLRLEHLAQTRQRCQGCE